MIKLEDVSYFVPHTKEPILSHIDWTIGSSEKWILFGRNGSGKTRLLEVVAGYLYPSAGSVVRFGSGPGEIDIRELRRRIGYISSSLRDMFPRRETALDVILSGLYASIGLYDEPSERERDKARSLLSVIGMEHRARDPFGVFSDGEKQKLLMLRSLIRDPELLLFDEACLGLDLPSREDLLASIETAASRHPLAVIYVTHHTEEITRLFGSIFIIDKGACFYRGGIEQGLDGERLSGLFGRDVRVEKIKGRYFTRID